MEESYATFVTGEWLYWVFFGLLISVCVAKCHLMTVMFETRAKQSDLKSLHFFLCHSSVWHAKNFCAKRLNKQAGPGTKSLPLRNMWQQNPLKPPHYPNHHSTLDTTHSHCSTHTQVWAKRRKGGGGGGRWGRWILISIQWMSPPHKGDHMTLPLNQSKWTPFSLLWTWQGRVCGGVCEQNGGWWGCQYY